MSFSKGNDLEEFGSFQSMAIAFHGSPLNMPHQQWWYDSENCYLCSQIGRKGAFMDVTFQLKWKNFYCQLWQSSLLRILHQFCRVMINPYLADLGQWELSFLNTSSLTIGFGNHHFCWPTHWYQSFSPIHINVPGC